MRQFLRRFASFVGFRLTLGGSAYGSIRTALNKRLSELDEQKEIAEATDVDI